MQLSIWEQEALMEADFIVVGAGLIGLQTALELRNHAPTARILVLERGVLPAGASSRNAGFACFGSLTEILHDFGAVGVEATLALVERRWRGLARLRARVGDAVLGLEQLGGYELLDQEALGALERIDEVNALLHPLFGRPVFSVDENGLRAAGFGPRARALVTNPLEAQLHAGRMMAALHELAGRAGITVLGGIHVQHLEEDDGGVSLAASSAADARALRFRAARVALCTNAFLAELMPDCGIVPARGQILLTDAVPQLRWRGTFHMDQGYYYFRNLGDRVLLGGARNLDFATEHTTMMETTPTIQHALETLLRETLLPDTPVRIVRRWAGVMGFSPDKQPRVQVHGARVAIGFGCNGMGVALGADIAARTAALLT